MDYTKAGWDATTTDGGHFRGNGDEEIGRNGWNEKAARTIFRTVNVFYIWKLILRRPARIFYIKGRPRDTRKDFNLELGSVLEFDLYYTQ